MCHHIAMCTAGTVPAYLKRSGDYEYLGYAIMLYHICSQLQPVINQLL